MIPAFNEAASVAGVVERLVAIGMECVVVDDGSTDHTASVARAAGAPVIKMPVNVGVGGALRCGFAYATRHGFKRVVQVDGDGQHDPAAIEALIAAADGGNASLVIGSRFADGYRVGRIRRLAMRGLAAVVRAKTGVALTDVTSGFRVITEPLLSEFAADYPSEYLGDTVEAIVAAAAGGHIVVEAAVRMVPRAAGEATPRLAATGHLLRVMIAVMVRRGRPS